MTSSHFIGPCPHPYSSVSIPRDVLPIQTVTSQYFYCSTSPGPHFPHLTYCSTSPCPHSLHSTIIFLLFYLTMSHLLPHFYCPTSPCLHPLPTEFDRPDVTLCGCRDVKMQLLVNCIPADLLLSLTPPPPRPATSPPPPLLTYSSSPLSLLTYSSPLTYPPPP